MAKTTIRDRIIDFRRVLASELMPDPKNWRRHPKAQRDALAGVLEEIGYADALLVRETVDGLQLIDGHLRAETTPGQLVPVLVLDVNEAEAAKLLATLDPLAAMAETDAAALDALLRDVDTGNAALAEMLGQLAEFAEATALHDADGAGGHKGLSGAGIVKMVIPATAIADVEGALRETGARNRGEALAIISRAYLEAQRAAKR